MSFIEPDPPKSDEWHPPEPPLWQKAAGALGVLFATAVFLGASLGVGAAVGVRVFRALVGEG